MNGHWLDALMPHLLVAPILLPMLTAALMLLLGRRMPQSQRLLGVLSTALGLGIAIALLAWVKESGGTGAVGVYLPGNWPVPFGIVIAADRLTAMMLLITAIVASASLLFSAAGWDKAGVHFHPLFQLQLMGLNGAFLTADLFNLFVFFEIMLTASYGLLLHGSGWPRVRSGLHYVALNLMASLMFLLGAALLYGITGTLNLADMAVKIPQIPTTDRGLLHAGAAILAVAFLTKAAVWPLNFWLTPAYASASPPVAALFALMTKVGLYALLRLWTLLFPPTAEGSAMFGSEVLVWGGLITLAFGAIGMLASQQVGRLAGFSVLVSSGTLLAAFGFGQSTLTGAALYYLMSSTLALCALFLITDLVERSREADEPLPPFDMDDESLPFPVDMLVQEEINLDDQEDALIGRAIPAAMAFLGATFIACALLIAGLPPLSGFVGKVAMLTALFNPYGLTDSVATIRPAGWALLILLVLSGLLALIAFSRAGIRFFWAPQDRPAPRLRVIEFLPISALMLLCLLLVVRAEPVLAYTYRTTHGLHQPDAYVGAVMAATVRPGQGPLKPPAPLPVTPAVSTTPLGVAPSALARLRPAAESLQPPAPLQGLSASRSQP